MKLFNGTTTISSVYFVLQYLPFSGKSVDRATTEQRAWHSTRGIIDTIVWLHEKVKGDIYMETLFCLAVSRNLRRSVCLYATQSRYSDDLLLFPTKRKNKSKSWKAIFSMQIYHNNRIYIDIEMQNTILFSLHPTVATLKWRFYELKRKKRNIKCIFFMILLALQ